MSKIDILVTRKISNETGKFYKAVSVRAEGSLVRTSTVNKLEFGQSGEISDETMTLVLVETAAKLPLLRPYEDAKSAR